MSLDFTAITAAHDAIRRDFARFIGVLGGTDPMSAMRAAALQQRWALVTGALADLGAAEADVLWPAVLAVVAQTEAGPLSIASEKRQLLADRVALASAALVSGGVSSQGRERVILTENVERLAVLADQHFAQVETAVLPLVDRYLPPEQWQRISAALDSVGQRRDKQRYVPWLLDSAPPDRIASTLAALSAKDQESYVAQWKPAYRELAAALW